MAVYADELSPDVRRKLKLPAERRSAFTMHDVRRHSIRVLAPIADLTQEQRRRVLEHALKLNRV